MKSQLFHTGKHVKIAHKIRDVLNSHKKFLTKETEGSPRAVGDAIQTILGPEMRKVLGSYCKDYSYNFPRRAMADIAFTDKNDLYYVVDILTHRLDSQLNMPEITSVKRLSKFYQDDKNYFVILVIKYHVRNGIVNVKEVIFTPIEFLSWDCLMVGNLGWGQIMIRDSNNIRIKSGNSRKNWMLEFCDIMLSYYPKEIGKIQQRMKFFKALKKTWLKKL